MSISKKLIDFDTETFEQTFARTKRLSDFIAFLSRLALLQVFGGLVNARIEAAKDALTYWNYTMVWWALVAISVHFTVLVVRCINQYIIEFIFEATESYQGMKRILVAAILVMVGLPAALAMFQIQTMASQWGREQAAKIKLEKSGAPATEASPRGANGP